MSRRALLVGINAYKHFNHLSWCISDALAMLDVLAVHGNGAPNFNCRFLLGPEEGAAPTMLDPARVQFNPTFNVLKEELRAHFMDNVNPEDSVLLYYSGHGYTTAQGRFLVTQDGNRDLIGLDMNELLKMANNSPARTVTLLLDTCYAGGMGEGVDPNEEWDSLTGRLRDGVTILAATKPEQRAIEIGGHGIFTKLIIGALKGGAADLQGIVNAAGIYAFVEQALGPFDQRPVYKTNASRSEVLRYCEADIPEDELRQLHLLFKTQEYQYLMDPSYEVTSENADPEHVRIFRIFKHYQTARLLRPFYSFDKDLYWVAMRSHGVELTPLGQFYWQLAKEDRLPTTPSFQPPRSATTMQLDAESLAKLFHETYERLAPHFGYETREASRKPWESVPKQNRNLMIAVATEILGTLFPAPMNQQPAPATEPSAQPTSPTEAPTPRSATEDQPS